MPRKAKKARDLEDYKGTVFNSLPFSVRAGERIDRNRWIRGQGHVVWILILSGKDHIRGGTKSSPHQLREVRLNLGTRRSRNTGWSRRRAALWLLRLGRSD